MSHERQLLLNAVLHQLSRAPSCPLGDLARELCVSRRTIEIAVSITTGKTFRDVREQMLVERVKSLLESSPTRAIKELSFDLGYKSPSSFARAIKRACGCSPEELRSRVIHDLLSCQREAILLNQ